MMLHSVKGFLSQKMLILCLGLCMWGNAEDKFIRQDFDEKLNHPDLTFSVSFDKESCNADFAKGNKFSNMKDVSLMLRMELGFDKSMAFKPLNQESLRFDAVDNASPLNGTLSFWVKACDYTPGNETTNGVHRGNIALAHLVFSENPAFSKNNIPDIHSQSNAPVGRRMVDFRIYEYGAFIYCDWRSSDSPHTYGNVGRIQLQPSGIKKDEWFQLAVTWNDKGKFAFYLNGEEKAVGLLPPKHAKLHDFITRSGFIGPKSLFYWDRNKSEVCVDDFQIFSRAFNAIEIKNRYQALLKDPSARKIQNFEVKLNGVDKGTKESLDCLEAEFDFTALPEELGKKLREGTLQIDYKLMAPDKKMISKGTWQFGKIQEVRMFRGIRQTGEYTLLTEIDGKGQPSVKIFRPDLSFAYNHLAEEDQVPPMWKDFRVEGRTVTLWNRIYKFGQGPLPESILVKGKKLLSRAPELHIDQLVIRWQAGRITRTGQTVTFHGTGTAGNLKIAYQTTVEYDGMMKFEWKLDGKNTISDMNLTWQTSPDHRKFLMAPELQDPNKKTFSYPYGYGSTMLWLVSPKIGGFACTFEHDGNWIHKPEEPVFFADREQGKCRVQMINQKTALPANGANYHALFIATPTRPLPKQNRMIRFGDEVGLVHADGNGGFVSVGTFLPHPTDFKVKMKDRRPMTGSVYGLANALTDDNPYVKYFRKYWAIPRGAVCLMGYNRPLKNGKYKWEKNTLYLFCNRTCFQDYIINNQQKLYNTPYGDRIFQIYYDHCGNFMCRNSLHHCQFRDDFGRSVSKNEILTKRNLIRRTVVLAHRNGRSVMCHGQRHFYPFICGMTDYWFPGEQHSSAVQRNLWTYTDEVPDEIYQSEYNRDVLGVGVIFLPALWYADRGKESTRNPVYTEAMISQLALNDIESCLEWAKGAVFRKFWDILDKYQFSSQKVRCHLYNASDAEKWVKSSSPYIRVTWYECPDNHYLFLLANKDLRSRNVEIDISGVCSTTIKALEEYTQTPVEIVNGKFKIRVPRRSFRIVAYPPVPYYPVRDNMNRRWGAWQQPAGDTSFAQDFKNGIDGSACLDKINAGKGGGCFHRTFPCTPGKTYALRIKARQPKGGQGMSMSIQGHSDAGFVGAPPVSVKKETSREWVQLELIYKIPIEGNWGKATKIMVTLGDKGTNCNTLFDDFVIEEK